MKYDVALSFAGEDRQYVEAVANVLKELGVNVFYDNFETVDLWGKDLYTHLQNVYQNEAKYTVIFISKYYAKKLWTNHERKMAQARAFTESREYILPVRFDDTEIEGITKTVGFIDLNRVTPKDFAEMILRKIEYNINYSIDFAKERLEKLKNSSLKDDINNPESLLVNSRNVFVVHGRNTKARKAIFQFIRSIGLHPLEWAEVVEKTGKTSPYIGEILDTAFSIAQAAIILFTPDDEARLKEEFRDEKELLYETELTGQARANVIFEAGMALSKFPDRTILVELGDLRPISDIGGRHVIRLNNSVARRQELAQRLKTAGCDINLSGTDWHDDGNFELESFSRNPVLNSSIKIQGSLNREAIPLSEPDDLKSKKPEIESDVTITFENQKPYVEETYYLGNGLIDKKFRVLIRNEKFSTLNLQIFLVLETNPLEDIPLLPKDAPHSSFVLHQGGRYLLDLAEYNTGYKIIRFDTLPIYKEKAVITFIENQKLKFTVKVIGNIHPYSKQFLSFVDEQGIQIKEI